jgi:cytochrome c
VSRVRNAQVRAVHAGSILICGTMALAVSLSLARIHPFGDAGLYEAKGAETPLMNHPQVPAEVRRILVEKCADCHSNQPRVPLYGRLAPASWMMERDIVKARDDMNLSRWDSYSAAEQQTLVAKMVHEMKTREMPPVQYRVIHWNSWITDADVRIFGQWAHGPQAMQAGANVAGEGDPVRGKALFEKRCTGCHALTQNHEGPQLQGVYGRTSGAVPGFAYSAALKKAQIVWDEKSLERWLTDPDAFIPGNDMDFLVSKPQERQDLISYLKQTSGR